MNIHRFDDFTVMTIKSKVGLFEVMNNSDPLHSYSWQIGVANEAEMCGKDNKSEFKCSSEYWRCTDKNDW